ncbi:MAG TPA: hypothetical protein VNZ53_60405 [Steroidobacteraceae bacterium]|nr:hypothetical protein [Steroidobacteraceae bacterium]
MALLTMAVLTPRGRDGTDQFLNGRDRSAHGHPVFVHGDPGWRSPSALSRTLPRALASRISAKVEPAPRYSQAGDVTGAAEAALALQRVGDAAFDASHRAYLRALGAVDHGQRTEDFMDSAQQIGVSTARAGIRAASSYRRRDRRQVL